ncbi:hypothetical protein NG819_14365 [Pseudarthrobacter sp. Fe7]|nr:hypothetical protein NG819_14365 [Pseudarthrobacter sp. Fe7]
MGRVLDGVYTEFTCVPAGQVVPFEPLSNEWTVPDFYPIDYMTPLHCSVNWLSPNPGDPSSDCVALDAGGSSAASAARRR